MAENVLTIQRSKWRRGGVEHNKRQGLTRLLNEHGLMCCLGFDALACGVPEAEVKLTSEPCDLSEYVLVQHAPEYLKSARFFFDADCHYSQSELIQRAMEHNDDDAISEPERERLIREDLIALGWDDVVFVD
jgi:hypothetical protein